MKIVDKIVVNVDRFRYLEGLVTTNDGRDITEIRTRIAVAKRLAYMLKERERED